MDEREMSRNRKIALIIFIGLIVAILAFWLIPIIFKPSEEPKEIDYGPGVEIIDLEKQVSGIPGDFTKNLEADLYATLKKNNASVNHKKTKAQIRSGSIESKDDTGENSYYRTFIVDIESLKQSYRVQLNWALNENGAAIPYGYPIVVSCLFNTDEAIYGDFGCMDDFKEMNL